MARTERTSRLAGNFSQRDIETVRAAGTDGLVRLVARTERMGALHTWMLSLPSRRTLVEPLLVKRPNSREVANDAVRSRQHFSPATAGTRAITSGALNTQLEGIARALSRLTELTKRMARQVSHGDIDRVKRTAGASEFVKIGVTAARLNGARPNAATPVSYPYHTVTTTGRARQTATRPEGEQPFSPRQRILSPRRLSLESWERRAGTGSRIISAGMRAGARIRTLTQSNFSGSAGSTPENQRRHNPTAFFDGSQLASAKSRYQLAGQATRDEGRVGAIRLSSMHARLAKSGSIRFASRQNRGPTSMASATGRASAGYGIDGSPSPYAAANAGTGSHRRRGHRNPD